MKPVPICTDVSLCISLLSFGVSVLAQDIKIFPGSYPGPVQPFNNAVFDTSKVRLGLGRVKDYFRALRMRSTARVNAAFLNVMRCSFANTSTSFHAFAMTSFKRALTDARSLCVPE